MTTSDYSVFLTASRSCRKLKSILAPGSRSDRTVGILFCFNASVNAVHPSTRLLMSAPGVLNLLQYNRLKSSFSILQSALSRDKKKHIA